MQQTQFGNKKWLVAGAIAAAVLVAGGLAIRMGFGGEPAITGEPPTVRLISAPQYIHAIRDLFGPDIRVDASFAPPTRKQGLLSLGAAAVVVTPSALRQFDETAREVAAQIVDKGHRDILVPCAPRDAHAPDDDCAGKFFARVGRLLYRRTLTDAEHQVQVRMAHEAATTLGDFYAGLADSLAGMLASPKFLYFAEVVEPDPGHAGQYRLDSGSKATRLSLFLWDSLPDAALLAAAEAGELHTSAGLKRQVKRMLAARERLERGTRAFFADLLLFEKFETLSKDVTIYPAFTPGIVAAAHEQMLRLITDHLLEQKADYRDLFTTRRLPIDAALAPLYKVPLNGEGWVPVTMDVHRSAGLATTLGFLAVHSHPGRSSPTLRGKAIRETLLCQKVPDPPPNVNFQLFEGSLETIKTARMRLTAHSSDPVCAGCHKITDPIGLSFEHFDGAGLFRTQEQGAAIDAGGKLDGVAFADVTGFGRALREHPSLPACLVSRVYAHGVGRQTGAKERPYLAYLVKRFAVDGYRYPDLLERIAMSRAFLAVTPPTATPSLPGERGADAAVRTVTGTAKSSGLASEREGLRRAPTS